MSPVSPAFHTLETVQLPLNLNGNKHTQSRDKMSMLDGRALHFASMLYPVARCHDQLLVREVLETFRTSHMSYLTRAITKIYFN